MSHYQSQVENRQGLRHLLALGFVLSASLLMLAAPVAAQTTQTGEIEFPFVPTDPRYVPTAPVDVVCNVGFGGIANGVNYTGGGFTPGNQIDPGSGNSPPTNWHNGTSTPVSVRDIQYVVKCVGIIPENSRPSMMSMVIPSNWSSDRKMMLPFQVHLAGAARAANLPLETGYTKTFDGEFEWTGEASEGKRPAKWTMVGDHSWPRYNSESCPSHLGTAWRSVGGTVYPCQGPIQWTNLENSGTYQTTHTNGRNYKPYVSTDRWNSETETWFTTSIGNQERQYWNVFIQSISQDSNLQGTSYPNVYPMGSEDPSPGDSLEFTCSVPSAAVAQDGVTIWEGTPARSAVLAPSFFLEQDLVTVTLEVSECPKFALQFGENEDVVTAPSGTAISGEQVFTFTPTTSGVLAMFILGYDTRAAQQHDTRWFLNSTTEWDGSTFVDDYESATSFDRLTVCFETGEEGGLVETLNPMRLLRGMACMAEELIVPQIGMDEHLARMRTATIGRVPFSWIESGAAAVPRFTQGISGAQACDSVYLESSGTMHTPEVSFGSCSDNALPSQAVAPAKAILRFGIWASALFAIWSMAPWREAS